MMNKRNFLIRYQPFEISRRVITDIQSDIIQFQICQTGRHILSSFICHHCSTKIKFN